MEHERNLGKRFAIAGSDLRAYWRLAVKYRTPHYLVTGVGETVKDFVAGKDTMLEFVEHQLRELRQDQQLEAMTDNSKYIQ